MASRKIQAVLAQMQKNLECSICLEMMKNPISTACGHQFCRFCIMEFLERKKQVPCPLCKKSVTKRGLMEREQLGQMVSDVHKLIEAYQADTGTIFSPPRGASLNLLPSTPECIKTKPSDQVSVRPMNTRGSGPSSITERRKSLPIEVKRETNRKTRDKKSAKQNMGSGTQNENSADVQLGNSRELQQLLDVIEMGTHGAINNDTTVKGGTRIHDEKQTFAPDNFSNTVVEKNLQNKVEGKGDKILNGTYNSNSKDHVAEKRTSLSESSNVDNMNRVDNEMSEGATNCVKNEVEEKSPIKANIDQTQSSVSSISQPSSEDVVSLFRTPLDAKEIKQNKTQKAARTTRSQRYKSVLNTERDQSDYNEPSILTPDNQEDKTVFTPKLDPIKTYSKKGTFDKKENKSKRKVSDWLKNMHDTDIGNKNSKAEKKKSNDEQIQVDSNSKKGRGKNMKVVQQREAVMGEKMRKLADMVTEDETALFGFEGIDGEVISVDTDTNKDNNNESGIKEGNEKFTAKDCEQSSNSKVKFTRQEKDESNLIEKDEMNMIEKDVYNITELNEANFEKDETNVIEKVEINFMEKGEISVLKKNNRNVTPEITIEDKHEEKHEAPNQENKMTEKPAQRKRIFKSKQVTSQANNKQACKENHQPVNEEIPIEPTKTETDRRQKPVTDSKKSNRLLQLSDSPITNNSDPYEFRSSQKTPQKPKTKAARKKGTRTKNNKSKISLTKTNQVNIVTMKQSRNNVKQDPMEKNGKSLYIDQGGNSQNNSQIRKIAEDLNQAEDYDLLTSTQEVLTNMTDVTNKRQGDENNVSKKKVRFKEPSLADFISPGKINIPLYRKEKQSYEKWVLQTDEKPCHEGKISLFETHSKDGGVKMVDKKEPGTVVETDHKKQAQQKEENVQINQDSDSDDLSEDFRFHDDSSGTDDLDINPEQDEFEPPNIDCQPEEIKEQLVEKDKLSTTPVETETKQPPPEMSCVLDTPQVSARTLLKTGFAIPAPPCKSNTKIDTSEPETPTINVVPETPLICMAEEERNQGTVEAPVTDCGNIKDKGAKANAQTINENPLPAKIDTDKSIAIKKDSNIEYDVVISDSLGVKENDDKGIADNDQPLNLDISTLEDNDEVVDVRKEVNGSYTEDKHDAESVSKTLIATKIDTESIVLIENTEPDDETQSPNIIEPEGLVNGLDIHKDNLKDQLNEGSSVQAEIPESVDCSQSSVSVLDINQCGKDITVKMSSVIENIEAIGDSDESSGSKIAKTLRKKRKCFMLEDTQEMEESLPHGDSPIANKPKKQKIQTNQSEDVIQGTDENISKTVNLHQKQDLIVSIHAAADIPKEISSNVSQGIVLISQNSVEMESPGSKERHLSGILISPTEKTGGYQSPEDIFCMESEMPAVALSPEEDTQCTEGSEDIVSTKDSSSQRTHVSETQKSLLEDSFVGTDSSDKKRKDSLRASRGFSKRLKTSKECIDTNVSTQKTHVIGTPKSTPKSTPKNSPRAVVISTPKTGVVITPKSQVVSTPKTPKLVQLESSYKEDLPEVPEASVVEVVTAVNSSVGTPRQRNMMKYKSPVVGLKSMSPSSSLVKSPSLATRISKYSPRVRNTLPSPLSMKEKRPYCGKENGVEVVEVNKKDIEKIDNKVSNIDDEDKTNHDVNIGIDDNVIEETDLDSSLSDNNKTKSNKKSPKLRLLLSSQEKLKMIEPDQKNQIKNDLCDTDYEEPLEKCLNFEQSFVDGNGVNEKSDKYLDMETDSPNEKQKYDELDVCSPSALSAKSRQITCTGNEHGNAEPNNVNANQYHLSSPEFELDESGPTVEYNDKGYLKTKPDDEESFGSDSKRPNFAGSFKPFSSLDLDFDSSDSEDHGVEAHKEKRKNNIQKPPSQSLELEAEVIEESDLDEDSYVDLTTQSCHSNKGQEVNNRRGHIKDCEKSYSLDGATQASQDSQSDNEDDKTKQDNDVEELRTVKQIRPKRAILSDSESDVEDESLKLDYTSSSAFSSQSENLTTQEREKLENDLEKMAAEMAQLKEQLNRNKTGDNKDPVVILDDNDDDDDDIEAHTSDVEMTHDPCYSPPPYSPVIMSQQEKSHDQNEEDHNESDAQFIHEEDIRNTPTVIRQPLRDIDINVHRDQSNKYVKKKVPGFLATGLSSAQVTEIKKLAAVNEIQFYTKMCPAVTHVIVKPADEDMKTCDRTLKFFQGIAHKCWIISYQWIIDSKESGYLLSEASYEIQGDSTMGSSHQGPKRSRLSMEDLFTGIHFSLFGDNRHLNQECISDLIETSGGIIVDEHKLGDYGRRTLMICCTDMEEDGSQQEQEIVKKSKDIKKKYGVHTLKRDWVMDSLTTYKLQPTKLYTVMDLHSDKC